MSHLKDSVVLLTGGSRGIGPVIAHDLALRGATLALAARSRPGLQHVARSIRRHRTKVLEFPVDLGNPSQRQRLVTDVIHALGRIDILINNAGIETEGEFAELSWPAIRETIEVNLVAPVALTHLVLPDMLARREGHIVNIASIAAKTGAPFAAVYSGTKAGLAEWTRALRLELADSGVHFSTIFPGYVREVGMFAKFGVAAPWVIGSCAPDEVATAVLAAIENCDVETIVNSRPLRYSFMINEMWPALGDWLMRMSGAVDFQRHKIGNRSSRSAFER
jgi:short-subunit dehydrogenase